MPSRVTLKECVTSELTGKGVRIIKNIKKNQIWKVGMKKKKETQNRQDKEKERVVCKIVDLM